MGTNYLMFAARLVVLALLMPGSVFAADCTPKFPYKDGWLGADAAYSIPLSGERSLWLFGDTFVRGDSKQERAGSRMVPNSVALATCNDGAWDIRYSWGGAADAKPRPFFDSGSTKFDYWPMDGFLYNGGLFVALTKVQKNGGGPFGFQYVGVDLAEVADVSKPPEQWRIQYHPLASGTTAFPGVSINVSEGYAYLYAVLEGDAHKGHPMIVARLPLSRLKDPAAAIEYLSQKDGWRSGLDWKDAKIVMATGATEMTVRYHPELKKWVAVLGKPRFLSNDVVLRTSDSLLGPWSEDRTIYPMPEMEAKTEGYDKDTFCYAAKEHPEYAASGLLMTYACNSFDFKKQLADLKIYRPIPVRLGLKR